jgi:hypothetical protein
VRERERKGERNVVENYYNLKSGQCKKLVRIRNRIFHIERRKRKNEMRNKKELSKLKLKL